MSPREKTVTPHGCGLGLCLGCVHCVSISCTQTGAEARTACRSTSKSTSISLLSKASSFVRVGHTHVFWNVVEQLKNFVLPRLALDSFPMSFSAMGGSQMHGDASTGLSQKRRGSRPGIGSIGILKQRHLNVQRAIDEDSPFFHRCQSQYFNPSKGGSPILGSPFENWDLPTLPDARDGSYTDEVPSRFRECLQILRDAVRPGAKQLGVHERIVGQGDSSEEVLGMGRSFTDGTARCTRCGSLRCNFLRRSAPGRKCLNSSENSTDSSWITKNCTKDCRGTTSLSMLSSRTPLVDLTAKCGLLNMGVISQKGAPADTNTGVRPSSMNSILAKS